MREPQLARMVLDQRDHEMQLDVRLGKVRPGFQEAAGFGEIAGDHAAPLAAIARDFAQQARPAARCDAGEVETGRGVAEHEIGMVLQVLPNPRQVEERFDSEPARVVCRSDSGQHQDLRGLQGAGADDHLAPRAKAAHNSALLVFDADRAAAVEQDASRLRAGFHPQIGARRPMNGCR